MVRPTGVRSVIFLVLASAAGCARPPAQPPNIVVIVGGAEILAGAPGSADDWARSALLFSDGVLPLAPGRPALDALLTGLYPHQAREPSRSAEETRAEALPQLLRAHGYATFACGSAQGGARDPGFERGGADLAACASELTNFVAESAGRRPLLVWLASGAEDANGPVALEQARTALVSALEQRGLAANTLVAVVGGEVGADPQPELTLENSRERNLACPLGFALAGRVAPGTRTEPVTVLDLYPTLLDYAGLQVPSNREGHSLRATLEGQAPPAPRRIFGTLYRRAPSDEADELVALTVRDGRWKYALFCGDLGEVSIDSRVGLGFRQRGDQSLFDLDTDPLEANSLFACPEHDARVSELRAAACAWWSASHAAPLDLPYTSPPLGAAPREPRPNIVLVVSDDQDYEHLGFLGNPRVHTPTLDTLAREGVLFPVAHVPMSRCRPSLAALLSGRWPHQNEVYDNLAAHLLSPRDSLPNLLKAAGYATYKGGKWWEGDPRTMGFLEPAKAVTATGFVRNNQTELFAFLDRYARERPFFVWWAPVLPHLPLDPPKRFQRPFRDTEVPLPPGIIGDPQAFRAAERTAFAMEAWFDDGLAALLHKLESIGELEETLFVFLIDNGLANGFPSKGTAFEKGLRTPVVFCWPKGFAGGRTDERLVSSLDIPATLLDFAGVRAPDGYQGISLRPTLEGREQNGRAALYGALYRYDEHAERSRPETDIFALYARDARWKFVLYLKDVRDPTQFDFEHAYAPFPERRRGERDLFDLTADPYERNDLSADPDQAARMAALQEGCRTWWKTNGGGNLELR